MSRTSNIDNILLSERSLSLFKALVEHFILDGHPVGSRTLARDSKLDLSPATIRNVMSDLEDMGLIHSPHTSAGRGPTVQGYRLFVDTMMSIRQPSAGDVERISSDLSGEADVHKLLDKTSTMLS